MKHSTFLASFLLGALLFSPVVGSAAPTKEQADAASTGLQLDSSEVNTYILNMGLSGTASAVVDLRATAGFLFSVTSSGSGMVYPEWNNVSTNASAWYPGVPVVTNSHQYIQKQAKFVRFRPSAFLDPKAKTSAYYSLVVAGGSTGSPTVVSDPALTTTNALLGALTASAGAATSVTNAAMLALLSETAQTKNLTTLAGISTALRFGLTCANGPATAVRYLFHPSLATAPTVAELQTQGRYLAASSTVQVDTYWVPGTHVSAVAIGGASANCNIELVR
jgi:hypothetical protein